MLKSLILIVSLFATLSVSAQQRFPMAVRKRPLLQELQLTARQRTQLQELVRQQRAQELLYNIRLQQILTPAQREKLRQYLDRKALTDSLSLEQPKKLP